MPPLFCIAKRKKGDKAKKERVSKQKLLKGRHQGQNIIIFSVPWPTPQPHPPTLKFISPALPKINQVFNVKKRLRTFGLKLWNSLPAILY